MLDLLINEAAAGHILRKETGLLLVAFGLVSVLFGQTVALAEQTRDPMPCFQPGAPGQGTAQASAGMPGVETGFMPIHGSMEALEWRLSLVDAAQHNIDMQYFIWRIDDTGRLLIERLLQAADRGIKVRLLLDDVLKGGLDEKWALILMEQFRHDMSPWNSYRMQIDADGSLYWDSASGRRDTQPARSLTQRARVLFYRLLPLDYQL